jgi:hypothetical protein
MPDRSRKRPRDPNQLGKLVVDLATGEAEDAPAPDATKRPGGKAGGKARASALSPERRREIAKSAAEARWKRAQDD